MRGARALLRLSCTRAVRRAGLSRGGEADCRADGVELVGPRAGGGSQPGRGCRLRPPLDLKARLLDGPSGGLAFPPAYPASRRRELGT